MEKKIIVFELQHKIPAYYDNWKFCVRMLFNRKGCIDAVTNERPLLQADGSNVYKLATYDEKNRNALG